MINKQAIIESTNLLDLVGHETTLKKVASSGGGEWAGPCPICGGHDRFRVQPYTDGGRWLCRHCTGGAWDTAIGYIMRRDNCDFKASCETLTHGSPPKSKGAKHLEHPAYQAPMGDWQTDVWGVIDTCERDLWSERCKPVLDYLRGRGLRDETIKHFRLGYCSTGAPDVYGWQFGGLWVPRGIVIPGIAGGEVWYLKIRLVPGVPFVCLKCKKVCRQPGRCDCGGVNKYRGVKGNRPAAIFNGDDLLSGPGVALFVEGEMDCMTAWQDLGNIVSVVTMGSATNIPDLATWGTYLLRLRLVIACYDDDEQGEKGLANLIKMTELVKLAPLPIGNHDINDFVMAGGDLAQWFIPYLQDYTADEKGT